MNHYTYKVTLPETGEYYVGVRSCSCSPLDDPYKGSMKSWKVDKTKLVKEIIANYATREEANDDEEYMINSIKRDWKDPLCKNAKAGKGQYCTMGLSIGKGRIFSEEHRKKLSEIRIGKSSWNKGKSMTEEQKQKLSLARKGREPWNKGKSMSEEQKQKLSESKKGKDPWNKGISHSTETKKKISEAKLKKKHSK